MNSIQKSNDVWEAWPVPRTSLGYVASHSAIPPLFPLHFFPLLPQLQPQRNAFPQHVTVRTKAMSESDATEVPKLRPESFTCVTHTPANDAMLAIVRKIIVIHCTTQHAVQEGEEVFLNIEKEERTKTILSPPLHRDNRKQYYAARP